MLSHAKPCMKQRQIKLQSKFTVSEATHSVVFCAQVPPRWDQGAYSSQHLVRGHNAYGWELLQQVNKLELLVVAFGGIH